MKGRKIFLFIFFILPVCTLAQNSLIIDSLKKVVAKNTQDTVMVNALTTINKLYNYTDSKEGLKYGKRAIELAEKLHYKKGIAFAYKSVGVSHYNLGEYVPAIKFFELAVAYFDTIGNQKETASMYSNIGLIYFNQVEDVKAAEFYFKALKIAEELNDSILIIRLLNNIGANYEWKIANFDKAFHNLYLAYPLALSIDDKGDPDIKRQKNDQIGTTAVNIGELYLLKYEKVIKKEEYLDSALFYFNKSREAYDEDSENLAYTLNDIGKAYMYKKDFKKAMEFQLLALDKSKKLDAKNDMAISLVGLAKTYLERGDVKAAISTYLEAEKTAKETGANDQLRETYEGLAKGYHLESDFRNAYGYAMLLSGIKDTIFNQEANKKLGTLQFTFDLERKDNLVKILTKDQEIKAQEIRRQTMMRNGFIGGFAVVLLFAGVFFMQRNKISKEKKRSDELLLNILPEETAEELKATGTAKAKSFDLVTVMFTDFKNFTQASERLSAEDLVQEINLCYSAFDHIITKYGIEKIKTIGDAYMCAGGLPVSNTTHPVDVVKAGLEFQEFIAKNKAEREAKDQPFFELRLGIHTGPVVAGIVGIKKFAYDIWGDTVNTASRMESSGETGKVNISGETFELIKHQFKCTPRGKIKAKNKGEIEMYFVEHAI